MQLQDFPLLSPFPLGPSTVPHPCPANPDLGLEPVFLQLGGLFFEILYLADVFHVLLNFLVVFPLPLFLDQQLLLEIVNDLMVLIQTRRLRRQLFGR